MSRFLLSLLVSLSFNLVDSTFAAESSSSPPTNAPYSSPKVDSRGVPAGSEITDPSYRLTAGDTIAVSIFGEPELAVSQTIDRGGDVRLPLIGEIILSGKRVRDAERAIEAAYSERQYLKAPAVSLSVVSYFPREVSVLGSVRSPGTVAFPRDVTSLDIVEVITRVGGFLPVSKSDAVLVTHRAADGKETVTTVDLENVISGRRQAGRDRANVAIYPGDRIWVPERLF